MSIDKFRDWFELIAPVAVVGSLIAVIVELRQTQTAMQAGVYQARAFNGIEYNWELARNDALRDMQENLYSEEFDPSTWRAAQPAPPCESSSQRLVRSMSSFISSPVCGNSSGGISRWFSGDSSMNWSNTGRTTFIG